MPYWAAHLQPNRANLALNLLQQRQYEVYYPRIPGRRFGAAIGAVPQLLLSSALACVGGRLIAVPAFVA